MLCVFRVPMKKKTSNAQPPSQGPFRFFYLGTTLPDTDPSNYCVLDVTHDRNSLEDCVVA